MRVDFNTPMEKGKISDDYKIRRTLSTIEYLKREGAKIILISHLGRPEEEKNRGKRKTLYSLKPAAKKLEKLLGEKIYFSKKITGKTAVRASKSLKEGEIILFENLRFEKGEKDNEPDFAKNIAALGDYFINEAFSVSHRKHASIYSVPQILPSFAGLNLTKEIETLSSLKNPGKRPYTAIIGGKKIESKIGVIEELSQKANHILLGGKIAASVLAVKGIAPGLPWPSQKTIDIIRRINVADKKFHLPHDAVAAPKDNPVLYSRITAPAGVKKGEEIYDIGPEAAKIFSEIIKESKTVLWAGPLGMFENEKFIKGSERVGETIAKTHNLFSVAGGGDTLSCLNKLAIRDNFSFVSTGGGALLSFLAEEEMPGLESL